MKSCNSEFCIGSFIESREFNKSEIKCSDQNKRKTVFVTSLFKNFEDANEACDKYKLNSMADEFKVKFFFFYKLHL